MTDNLFEAQTITDNVHRIIGPGQVYAYLIIGSEKALLLDTMCGIGDLKHFVEEFTDLPLYVANTHSHHDHCGGNFQFEKVFIHPADKEQMIHLPYQARIDYVRGEEERRGIPCRWNEQDVICGNQIETVDLHEGFTFDLGDCTIEVVEAPGHTYGSICFLDRKRRLMFGGDACNCNTILAPSSVCVPTTIEEYKESMQHLYTYIDEFDRFLICHGEWDLDKRCISEMIELCDEIMEGKDDAVPGEFLGHSVIIAKQRDEEMNRYDGKIANILYAKDHIFKKKN